MWRICSWMMHLSRFCHRGRGVLWRHGHNINWVHRRSLSVTQCWSQETEGLGFVQLISHIWCCVSNAILVMARHGLLSFKYHITVRYIMIYIYSIHFTHRHILYWITRLDDIYIYINPSFLSIQTCQWQVGSAECGQCLAGFYTDLEGQEAHGISTLGGIIPNGMWASDTFGAKLVGGDLSEAISQ